MNVNEAIGILKDYRKGDFVNDNKFCEAIDTVLSLINTGNKTGLDERLQEKSIEQPDNQANLSYKKDMELLTDEQIEQYALENILDGVGIQSMINTKAWIAGATWMRDEIRGSLVVRRSEQLSCPRCRHTGIDTDKDGLNYCRGCSHYWRAT